VHLAGIGARQNEDLGAGFARVEGGAQAGERGIARNHVDPERVPAALRRHLILDHRAGKARPGIAADRAPHVGGVAEAGIGVADHRDLDRLANVPPLVEHLGVGDHPGIGSRQPRSRDTEPAHEGQRKARPLDQPRGERVETAGHHG
jgi:hypothetical protein